MGKMSYIYRLTPSNGKPDGRVRPARDTEGRKITSVNVVGNNDQKSRQCQLDENEGRRLENRRTDSLGRRLHLK